MTLLHLLSIVVLDLAAVYFNVRMVLSCFKDKTKYKFLQRGRILVICQFACNVTIIVTDARESWTGFNIEPSESCDVFRVLFLSVMFFQVCNLTAILIHFEHYVAYGTQRELSSAVALTFGLLGSGMIWWYNCFYEGYLSQVAHQVVFVATMSFILFVILLLQLVVALSVNNSNNSEDSDPGLITTTHSELSFTKTYYLLWNVCKDNKKPLFFTALLLASLVVILRGEPLGYIQDYEQTRSVLEEISSHSVILRFAVGIVLPVSLNDLICARLKENEMKIIVT